MNYAIVHNSFTYWSYTESSKKISGIVKAYHLKTLKYIEMIQV
jgi:hypothetical protein